MQVDSALLDEAILNKYLFPIVRFYGWEPACVSLGRNQSSDGVNLDYLNKHGIGLTKRLTGGRALLHDDELTYSFVAPVGYMQSESVIESYKEISNALIAGFSSLGIELEFAKNIKTGAKLNYCMSISSGADLVFKGKKIIGSAQCRKNGYLLQHGSILFSYDKSKIENIFNEKFDDSKITCIKDLLPALSRHELVEALKMSFANIFSS